MTGVRHLYVHLPFCAHRCGYCDFVTAAGRRDGTAPTSMRCSPSSTWSGRRSRRRSRRCSSAAGTPTFTVPAALERLLAGLPDAGEVTVEANPETVTPALAARCHETVSIGCRSARRRSSRACCRCSSAAPGPTTSAVRDVLRDAGFDNLSLDLVYGIPGQSPAELDRDLAEALALEPEHMSCYELEAKPGTRFTLAHGAELERQAGPMEDYFERVVAA